MVYQHHYELLLKQVQKTYSFHQFLVLLIVILIMGFTVKVYHQEVQTVE